MSIQMSIDNLYPRVDIVILNWNGLADTLDCIASVYKCGYPSINIQIVDNASTNDEASIIEDKYPAVKVIRQNENIGFCGGCNAGMRRALEEKADYIMLLNNDAMLTHGVVDKLLAEYSRLKKPGAISPVILNYPETSKVWFSKATWESRWKTGEAEFKLSGNEKYEDIRDRDPYETEFACGCCLLIDAKVVEEVGLLDERYFAFFDEAEWCARMKRKGYISYVIPNAFMYHKVGGTTPNLVMTYLMSRNRLLWMRDNLSWRKKIAAWPVIIKDLVWHSLNVIGLIPSKKQYMTKAYSQVAIRGFKDYLFRRFGKWNKEVEKLIFRKN